SIGAPGTAFAVVVLAAALAAAAPRRWLWLVVAVGGVSLAQVAWLIGAAPAADAGAIAVVAVASLVLLGGGIAWQAAATADGLDPVAATLMLAGGGLAFAGIAVLLPDNREAGVALAIAAVVYAAAGYAAARRWRDLGWVAGCVGLLLVGIATAYVFSERSLTVAWAIEAAALAVLAWRLGSPRFELASLTYVALGIAHLLVVDLQVDHPVGDLPRSAAVGLFSLAGAELVAGVLAVGRRRDPRSVGLLAPLEPLWDDLVRTRGTIRLWLWCAVVALGAAGTAALVSGRWLTVALTLTAAALALAAFALGERRLQAAGIAFLAIAAVHALCVEAKPGTLVLSRAADALGPVPSLAAVAAASAVLAVLSGFADRGIAFLGPLDGGEAVFALLGVHARAVRNVLLGAAAWFAIWAAGLVLVDVSYEPGQAGATALWAAAATVTAAAGARRRSTILALAAVPPTLLAYGKAVGFDWHELGRPWGPTAVLIACAALLLVGFFARYAAAEVSGVELASLGAAVVATVSALNAVHRLEPDRTRVLGAAAILIAFVVGALAVPPFRAWRKGRPERWLRDFATVYWSVALATLVFGELCIVDRNRATTVTLWALSGALVAIAARPLSEERFWLAGVAWTGVASIGCLAIVTTPSRLVVSSAHPGDRIWALAACVAALAWMAWLTPEPVRRAQPWIIVTAVALGIFGLSLGVLEIAERVFGASVQTNFQRGHTAVSALWGVLALGLFVLGLASGKRTVQRIGLALFGLALAKLFLYDLRNLSSITRALSFLAVGAILLTAAFFVERIVRGGRGGPRVAP
ncbi:MAG: DUF2339 domain-containing protein, partial [Gaiellaceae bacterium]